MKVITLSEVASRLRQRRQGRGYIGKFINECTIEDAIPLDKVKQAREEIDDLYRYYDNDYCSGNKDSMFKCDEVLGILDKLIAESEEY